MVIEKSNGKIGGKKVLNVTGKHLMMRCKGLGVNILPKRKDQTAKSNKP